MGLSKKIEYKGSVLETTLFKELSNEEYNKIVDDYYKKPLFSEVEKQFLSLDKGGVKNNYVTNYYVKDLMAKVFIRFNNQDNKWTIEEVLEYKPLVEFFMGKASNNEKVFPKNKSNCENFETALRLCGKGVASKPPNFPIKIVDEILNKYNINNNYYDFSCGWGARLTSALKNKVNYFGTDPNYLLTERLHKLSNDYKKTTNTNTYVDIRTQGSEIFIPEWENKIGLAFSSPPYFSQEDYKIGNQSYKEGVSYEDWKNNYLKPTIHNIFMYLIPTGHFVLNIDNFREFKLIEDSILIAKEVGFNLVGEHQLRNIKRCYGTKGKTQGINDNGERILVFAKKGHENDINNIGQLSIFDN